jgi:hypothetical protein
MHAGRVITRREGDPKGVGYITAGVPVGETSPRPVRSSALFPTKRLNIINIPHILRPPKIQ